MDKSGGRVRIKLEYKVQYADPLRVVAGEIVTVGREDEEFPGWKWCKASDGREGWIPVELLSHEKGKATVLHDYSARELAVRCGEEVAVQDERHGWLLVRNKKGKRGWICNTQHVTAVEENSPPAIRKAWHCFGSGDWEKQKYAQQVPLEWLVRGQLSFGLSRHIPVHR